MKSKNMIIIGAGALALIAATAGATTFIAKGGLKSEKPAHVEETITWNQPAAAPAQRQTADCDDDNIVGNVIGGVGGGIAGSQVGKGKGKTAATIGGTLGGAYIGGKYIPTDNVTCKK